jgi:hypothetical protein
MNFRISSGLGDVKACLLLRDVTIQDFYVTGSGNTGKLELCQQGTRGLLATFSIGVPAQPGRLP